MLSAPTVIFYIAAGYDGRSSLPQRLKQFHENDSALAAEWTLDKLEMIIDDVPRNELEDIQGDDIGTDHTINASRRQNHR